MFSYISLGTNDLERAIRFYDPVMLALGAAYVRDPDGNKLTAGCRGHTREP